MRVVKYSARDRRQDYGKIFGSPEGRRVLLDIMRASNMGSSTAIKDSAGRLDSTAMILREGERNMAIRILQILEHDEGDLERMMTQEAINV